MSRIAVSTGVCAAATWGNNKNDARDGEAATGYHRFTPDWFCGAPSGRGAPAPLTRSRGALSVVCGHVDRQEIGQRLRRLSRRRPRSRRRTPAAAASTEIVIDFGSLRKARPAFATLSWNGGLPMEVQHEGQGAAELGDDVLALHRPSSSPACREPVRRCRHCRSGWSGCSSAPLLAGVARICRPRTSCRARRR